MAEEKRFGAHRRVPIVDAVRGVMIVYVALYHLLYDLVIFGLVPYTWILHPAVEGTHIVAFSTFVAFSGVSSRFSRSNLKRGIEMVVIAYIITFVTWFLDHEGFVRFGVLHFLGIAAILFWGMEKLWNALRKERPLPKGFLKVWNLLFPITMMAGYVLTYYYIYKRSYPVEGLAWLGFPSPAYYSTDYFPLIPFLFLYLFGTWLGRMIMEEKLPGWFYKINIPGFDKLGRYTLWIYLAHQPVFYGIAWLIASMK